MTTELQTKLEQIKAACRRALELSDDERVTEGPWFHGEDAADECGPHAHSGLALVETGRGGDWLPARLCEWPTAELIAYNRTFSAAAAQVVLQDINWFEEELRWGSIRAEARLQTIADQWP